MLVTKLLNLSLLQNYHIEMLVPSTFCSISFHFYLLESESGRRKTVATVNSGTNANDTSVNSTRDTVVELDVQLGDSIFLVDRSLLEITDGSSFDHVTDSETLDGLILYVLKIQPASVELLFRPFRQILFLPWGHNGNS